MGSVARTREPMVTWLPRYGCSRAARPAVWWIGGGNAGRAALWSDRVGRPAPERARSELPPDDTRPPAVRPQDRQRHRASRDPRVPERGARTPGLPRARAGGA